MSKEKEQAAPPIEQQTRPIEGIKGIVIKKILSGNVDDAIALFENHTVDVDQAIREYNTKSHSIMFRQDKVRKDKSDYRTWKLPRNWQQYINEIELYFLLANGIKWEMLNDDQEDNAKLQEAFNKFKKLLKKLHYDSRTREFKRLAGAETECPGAPNRIETLFFLTWGCVYLSVVVRKNGLSLFTRRPIV